MSVNIDSTNIRRVINTNTFFVSNIFTSLFSHWFYQTSKLFMFDIYSIEV